MTQTHITSRLFTLFLASVLCAISHNTAKAAQTQAYVASSADKGNPCTLKKPCHSVQEALGTIGPTATITVIENGEYEPFEVNAKDEPCIEPAPDKVGQCSQHITIEPAPGIVATIAGRGSGDAILINAGWQDVVTIRGFRLDHFSVGIGYASAMAVHVESCYIYDCAAVGIDLDRARKDGKKRLVNKTGGQLFVTDSFFNRNAQGILVQAPGLTSTASIDHCRFEVESTAAVDVGEDAKVVVRDSVFANCADYAVRCRSNKKDLEAQISIENSSITGTGYACVSTCPTGRGILAGTIDGGAAHVWLSNTTVTQNQVGIEIIRPHGLVYSFQNNRIGGNRVDVKGRALQRVLLTNLIGFPLRFKSSLIDENSVE